MTYTICGNCSQVNRVPLDSPQGKAPICGKCKSALPVHGGVSDVNASGISLLSQKISQPVIVDFWGPWCQPCKVFAPAYQQAARLLVGRAVLTKVDTQANPLASDHYHIRAVPTFIIVRNGVEIARQSGAVPLDFFLNWVNSYLQSRPQDAAAA